MRPVSLVRFPTAEWSGHQAGYRCPIDAIQQCGNVICAAVLVIEVIGVFPNVDAQEGAALGRRVHDVHHEGVVLVGGGCHEKAIGVIDILHEPSPSGTEAASRSSSQGLQDTFMVTKGAVDALGQKA